MSIWSACLDLSEDRDPLYSFGTINFTLGKYVR